MKKTLIKTVVGLALVGLMVYLGRKYFDRLELILEVGPGMVAAMAAMFLLMRGVQGEVFRQALRTFDVRIGHYEAFTVSMMISISNLILPRAGIGAPAVYLKARRRLPVADFASLLLPITLLQLACIGSLGLTCQIWLWAGGRLSWQWPLAAALGGVLVGSLLALAMPLRIPGRWHSRVARFFRRFLESWSRLRRNRRLVLLIFVLQGALLLLQGARLWVCFHAMGFSVPIPAILLASFAGHVGTLVGQTPGGLGFREGGIVLVANILGVDPHTSVAAALLDRAVITVATILVGQLGLWQLLARSRARARPAEAGAGQELVERDAAGEN